MRKILLQLDSSRLPSVFDRVVAYDAGAEEVLSYGGIVPSDVRDLVHGLIFTRGPKDLANSAIFIGGSDINAGDAILTAAQETFFSNFRVSVMLDSNGSNTTAVAAVLKITQTVKELKGKRAVITAGTGPVGVRAAGLLSKAGADVLITSRKKPDGERAARTIAAHFGTKVSCIEVPEPAAVNKALDGANILLNCGPAGVHLVPRTAWANRQGLAVAIDLNATPPLGVEGIESPDNAVVRDGVTCFGALGVGNLKMKIHKACIAALFTKNDLVFDAETIHELAKEL